MSTENNLENIQNTQTYFYPFREAFADFGKKYDQTSSADAWRAWLTKVRIKQLKEMSYIDKITK